MRNLPAISALVLCSCATSFAQTSQTVPCPAISVTGPPGIPNPNEFVTFTAEIGQSLEKFNLILDWKVSNGKAIEGQGTKQIKVLWENVCENNLTAIVEIIGLPKNCQTTYSETAAVSCCLINPIQIDEFSISVSQIDKVRLENLAKESQIKSSAQIYIIERFEEKISPKTIELKNQKTIAYLKVQGIDRNRITLLNAVGKENQTRFFIVPPGASDPGCDDCKIIESK